MPDARRKKKLTDVQQEFVLRRLACGFGYQDTVNSIKEEFGISVSANAIRYYGLEYKDEIAALRKELTEDISRIPFANKLNRIAHLDVIAKRTYDRRNYPECRATLRQIAEETGEITNDRYVMPQIVEVTRTEKPPEGSGGE
ncbi:MAG: DUF2280 domain-containing protein [Armatimonadota bacterium]